MVLGARVTATCEVIVLESKACVLFLLEIKSRSLSVYDVSKSLLKIRYSRFHNIITRDGFVSFVTLYSVQFTLSTQLIKESHLM